MSPEDQATATGHIHRKFSEVYTSGIGGTLTNRQRYTGWVKKFLGHHICRLTSSA